MAARLGRSADVQMCVGGAVYVCVGGAVYVIVYACACLGGRWKGQLRQRGCGCGALWRCCGGVVEALWSVVVAVVVVGI